VCGPGDDGHYGSSSEHDVYALQAIARRIHFGAFYVAESKYRSAPGLYRGLAEKGDRAAIAEALTRPEVEKAVIDRVLVKVEKLQITVDSAKGGEAIRRLLRPEPVRDFYRDVVIPLTKEGEVRYLLNRKRD
jgi:chorismate mutase